MSIFTRALTATFILVLLASVAGAQIDVERVLFGVEYTFQDREMVNEPGRSTLSTPYKEAKVIEITERLRQLLNLPPQAIEKKTTWKPGLFLHVPGDGAWVINSEPVTIEINTPPRRLTQLIETAGPIFAATSAAGLQAYVQPAAERSGMGHIHIGARNMAENPFFANPLLLRNVMVALHKSPSLLHGFAEAFDIGMDSNIETYHSEKRQAVFAKAVAEFDAWYDRASPAERSEGFNVFLRILRAHDSPQIGFFQHYRFLNLEHVARGATQPFLATDTGKITVEFRNFRPPKNPETTKAFAELLLAILKHQTRPEHREPFEWIAPDRYLRFNTAAVVRDDWARTRQLLGLNIPELDEQIREYVDAVERVVTRVPGLPKARLYLAYSRKGDKGQFLELRLPAPAQGEPLVVVKGQEIPMQEVLINRKRFWTGVLDLRALGVTPDELARDKNALTMTLSAPRCSRVL